MVVEGFLLLWRVCAWSADSPAPDTVARTVEVRAPRRLGAPTRGEYPVERLLSDPARSPRQLLESSASVHGRDAGNGEGEWLVRGQDPIQSRLFLEGIPLETSLYQQGTMEPVPWEAVRAVELTAGGIPAHLGKGGLGGAVNLRLADPQPGVGLRVGSEGRVRVHGGWKGALAGTAEVRTGTGAFPYWDDGGTPLVSGDDRMGLREHNAFFQASVLPLWKLKGTGVDGFALAHYARRQIPGPVNLPRPGELDVGGALWRARVGWTPTLKSVLHVRADETRWKPRERFPSSVPSRVTAWGWGQRFQYEDSGTGAGLAVDFQHFTADGRDSRSWEFPVYAQTEWRAGGWSVRPALLAVYGDQRSGADRQSYHGVSPRLTGRWRFHPRWQLRASLSQVFRFPSLAERFGAPPFQAPNPALEPERGLRAEWGVDARIAPGRIRQKVSLTGFGQWSRNLVAYEQNAQRNTVAVNVGQARVLGLEGNWSGHYRAWSVRSAITVWDAINLTPVAYWQGKSLPHRPRFQWKTALSWERGEWGATYRVAWTGGSYRDLANYQWNAPHAIHGAEIRWNGPWGRWALEARNLTDVITVDSQLGAFGSQSFAGGFAGYPAPGRQWLLSWRTSL